MGRTEQNGQSSPPRSAVPPSRIAGRYQLVEKLGTGGMSVVWRGFDETLGRSVAVKVLSPRLADDQSFRDRLRQEALAAARLSHPHITGIFDFGESPLNDHLTVPYVVMELNDGESVSARLTRRGPLPWREAVTIAAEVASALATAHARGVVHRDVTPANVMLTATGAKVVDFGISAIVGERDAAPDGSVLGTPAYLAPERLSGAQVSTATDVYALGLLLYRLLTGRLPWPAETTAEALRAHLYADPDPLPPHLSMPPAIADLCRRCLAKAPADRPAAVAVARALAEAVGIQPVLPPLRTLPDDAPPPVRAAVPSASRPDAVLHAAATSAATSHPGFALADGTSAALGRFGGRWGQRLRHGRAGLVALRLRLTLKLAGRLRLGSARPLGGGLFTSGGLLRGALAGRHRVRAALITVALLAAAVAGWAATRESPDAEQAQAAGAAPGAVGATSTVCAVRYQLRHDSGRDYEALLTVATTGELGRSSWRVMFTYPGSQRLTAIPKAVSQRGRKVVAKGHGTRKTFTLRGAYRGDNPLPLSFTVDGRKCRAEVLGATAAESGSEPISDAAPQNPPARNVGGRDPKPNRPPRKSTSPRKRLNRAQPTMAPTGPSLPPPPTSRKAPGLSLDL